ncbi:MAG: hypothetical protein ACOYCA_04180 [Eggerthellaceae bacterium]|jgi:SrtB family sortase
MNKTRPNRWLYCFLVLFLILISISVLTDIYFDKSLQPSEFLTQSEDVGVQIDWAELKAKNPQVIAWVHMENTPINYPIVRAESKDAEFYLDHNLEQVPSAGGQPYLDWRSQNPGAGISWIFGHNLKAHRGFADFAQFTQEGFAKDHRVHLYLPDKDGGNTKELNLQFSSARIVDADRETPMAYGFENTETLMSWYVHEFEKAEVQAKPPPKSSALIAFVTCSYRHFKNERTIVYFLAEDTNLSR